jgi:hypothetical protein
LNLRIGLPVNEPWRQEPGHHEPSDNEPRAEDELDNLNGHTGDHDASGDDDDHRQEHKGGNFQATQCRHRGNVPTKNARMAWAVLTKGEAFKLPG